MGKGKGLIDPQVIIKRLNECPDIDIKKVFIDGKHEACFIYISGQVNTDIIQRDFLVLL